METSLNVYDYPSPPDPEENAREIRARVTISFDVEDWFSKDWGNDEIISEIRNNIYEYDWNYNMKVEEIDL